MCNFSLFDEGACSIKMCRFCLKDPSLFLSPFTYPFLGTNYSSFCTLVFMWIFLCFCFAHRTRLKPRGFGKILTYKCIQGKEVSENRESLACVCYISWCVSQMSIASVQCWSDTLYSPSSLVYIYFTFLIPTVP